MIKSTVIDTAGKTLFSTGGFLRDYSQGVFLIYKGKEREFVLVTRSGDLYPLPKEIFSEGPEAYLGVHLNGGAIWIQRVEKDVRYGLFKFTIKEK